MIEPTAFPRANPGAPCIAATTLTAASGSVVPTLTIVAPISILGTPHFTESDTAWSTRKSAPFTRTAIEAPTQAAREADVQRLGLDETPAIDDRENNFRPYDQRQRLFVDVSKDSFLEERHPAYHPKMMLKVLFYTYYIGVMSSRTIWDCVINRANFMYLAAGQVTNFRSMNSFRLGHLPRFAALFTEIVPRCLRLRMIGFEHLAIDGQKIQANTIR